MATVNGWQLALDGRDPIEEAVEILRANEPTEGYFLAFSGGKDSVCLYELALMAGVRFDAHYNVTTVDPPELVYFIRREYPTVGFIHPRKTMWQLIETRGLPTHMARFCCAELKETSGKGRVVATGVRHAESRARQGRAVVERNTRQNSLMVNPMVRWSDADVWRFIRERGLPYCHLYDEGFTRLGCIMCPMQTEAGRRRDAERWPKIAAAYKRAIGRRVTRMVAQGKSRWASGDEAYEWWMNRGIEKDGECEHGGLF